MDFFKIIGVGIIGALVTILLKTAKPEFSAFAVITTGLAILIIIVNSLSDVIFAFNKVGGITKIDTSLFSGILKIIGIGYITEYSSSICEDLQCKSIGEKLQLAGKITIFLLAMPIITALIEIIVKMLS